MAQKFKEITEALNNFILQQKLFFVGTATKDSKVNISPKGMNSLKIINKNRVAWLNVTGSGNETSAHIQTDPRMTIMFTSFEDKPMTLRLYGKAKVVHKNDHEWNNLISLFPYIPAARQIFDVDIELVQTSCGMSVPFFNYTGEREQLNELHERLGEKRIEAYWKDKNQHSIDGIPTHIMQKNT